MGRNPFPRGASEHVLPPPCTSLANLHSPHHCAQMQLSARNDLWHLLSLDPRASKVYLRCFGLFPRSWQEISLLKLTQCCRNIAADVPHRYPLLQLWKLKDQKGTFGSRGTFPRAGVAASASLARAAVPKQAASELFWTHPDEILQTEAKSGEYFQNSAPLWFPKVILSACKVAFTQMASGLKQELKRFLDSSRVVKNTVKEAVPMITDLLKPLWIMHFSYCKKAVAVTLLLIWMHRLEGIIIIFPRGRLPLPRLWHCWVWAGPDLPSSRLSAPWAGFIRALSLLIAGVKRLSGKCSDIFLS